MVLTFCSEIASILCVCRKSKDAGEAVSPELSLFAKATRAGRFKRALEVNPNKEKRGNATITYMFYKLQEEKTLEQLCKFQDTHAQASVRRLGVDFLDKC